MARETKLDKILKKRTINISSQREWKNILKHLKIYKNGTN